MLIGTCPPLLRGADAALRLLVDLLYLVAIVVNLLRVLGRLLATSSTFAWTGAVVFRTYFLRTTSEQSAS
jgi:hypothetical protein